MLRVGSLSRSYGWTIKNLTPSRSGVFFVDQTVPTTLARNIKAVSTDYTEIIYVICGSNLGKYFRRFANITRCGGDDRSSVDVDLLALLNRASHVVFTNKIDSLRTICRRFHDWRRRGRRRRCWLWRRSSRHAAGF